MKTTSNSRKSKKNPKKRPQNHTIWLVFTKDTGRIAEWANTKKEANKFIDNYFIGKKDLMPPQKYVRDY